MAFREDKRVSNFSSAGASQAGGLRGTDPLQSVVCCDAGVAHLHYSEGVCKLLDIRLLDSPCGNDWVNGRSGCACVPDESQSFISMDCLAASESVSATKDGEVMTRTGGGFRTDALSNELLD